MDMLPKLRSSLLIQVLTSILIINQSWQSYADEMDPYTSITNGGKVLRVASIESQPFLEVEELLLNVTESDDNNATTATKNVKYKGFIVNLLDEVANALNFEYEIVIPEDGKYGRKDDETGDWNGMIGMIAKDQADMIAADLTVTWARHEILDFSRPFMTAPLTLLTKREAPISTSYGMFNFFRPYSGNVWFLLFIAYMVTSLIFWFVVRVTPYERYVKNITPFTPTYVLWIVFSCFFRGSNYVPQAISTRLLTAGWWLFSLTILATYAINLRSFIATSFEPSSFHVATHVKELLSNPKFKIGVIQDGASYSMLENSQSPLHQKIFNRIMASSEQNLLTSITSGVEDLLHSETKFSGIIAEGSAADYLKSEHCQLYTVGNLLDRSFAFGFKKGSPFTEHFSKILLQLIESGRLHQIKDRWWNGKQKCFGAGSDTSSSDDEDENFNTNSMMMEQNGLCKEMAFVLHIRQMAWPFVFLSFILILSVIICLTELIVHIMHTPSSRDSNETKFARFRRNIQNGLKHTPPPHTLQNRLGGSSRLYATIPPPLFAQMSNVSPKISNSGNVLPADVRMKLDPIPSSAENTDSQEIPPSA